MESGRVSGCRVSLFHTHTEKEERLQSGRPMGKTCTLPQCTLLLSHVPHQLIVTARQPIFCGCVGHADPQERLHSTNDITIAPTKKWDPEDVLYFRQREDNHLFE